MIRVVARLELDSPIVRRVEVVERESKPEWRAERVG